MKYKAVLFDMDDTLIKTWEIKWEHHKFIAQKYYDIDLTDQALSQHWGKPFPLMIQALYGTPEPVEQMIQRFVVHEHEFLKPVHDPATAALATLQDNSVVLGVLTSMISDVAHDDMQRELPDIKFVFIQGADDTLVHKPDPLVFEPALNRLQKMGITKKDILYVGDALSDFYAARDAGIDFIAITTGLVDEATFKQAGVSKVLDSLAELPAIVLKKGKK